MSYMQHHFNVEIAKKFGINVAIFLDQMAFWITKNMANDKNFYDGTYWTYNTVEALTEIFPYWTLWQMRKVLSDCEKYGLINVGNYNNKKYDRTGWYSLTQESCKLLNLTILRKPQMDVAKTTNAFVENHKPIPVTNAVTNTSREPVRKKRELLSDDFKPDQEREAKAKAVSQKCDISEEQLLSKFLSLAKSSGKKSLDWQEEFEVFLMREKPNIKKEYKIKSKPNQEIKSIVPEFIQSEPIQQASSEIVNENMLKIKQLLSRKMINDHSQRENDRGKESRAR